MLVRLRMCCRVDCLANLAEYCLQNSPMIPVLTSSHDTQSGRIFGDLYNLF